MEEKLSNLSKNIDFDNIVKETYKRYKEINLVWFCKTIQNKKALYYIPEAKLFVEVTLNGDKREMYFDEYQKKSKMLIGFDEFGRPSYGCCNEEEK